jgi:hypothetical protein
VGIIFMGLGIAEVYQQPIPKELGDVPIVVLDDFRTSSLIGTDHVPVFFGVELGGECRGVHEIAEHDSELATFGVGRHGRGAQRRWVLFVPYSLVRRGRGGGDRRRSPVPGPHQHASVLVDREVVDLDQFLFEGVQGLVIQVKLEPQRPIGDPATLGEEVLDLIEHIIEVHYRPSTCASAASA